MTMSVWRRLAVLVGLLLVPRVPLLAQGEQINDAAKRLQAELKAAKPHLVAVVDFCSTDAALKPLAHYLARLLSAALEARKKKFVVAKHPEFDADLARLHLDPEILRSDASLRSAAPQIGADFLITGKIDQRDNSYFLQITPVRVAGAQLLPSFSAVIPTNEFLESVMTPLPSDVARFHGRPPTGYTIPSCFYCPDPSYTERARQAKVNGVVVLEVLVSKEGQTKQVHMLKMLGYGLDEKALEAIKGWKFRPATKDGSPIAVIVPVEVTFRTF